MATIWASRGGALALEVGAVSGSVQWPSNWLSAPQCKESYIHKTVSLLSNTMALWLTADVVYHVWNESSVWNEMTFMSSFCVGSCTFSVCSFYTEDLSETYTFQTFRSTISESSHFLSAPVFQPWQAVCMCAIILGFFPQPRYIILQCLFRLQKAATRETHINLNTN